MNLCLLYITLKVHPLMIQDYFYFHVLNMRLLQCTPQMDNCALNTWSFKYTYNVSVLNTLFFVHCTKKAAKSLLYFYNVTVSHSFLLNMLVYTP